MTFKTRAVRLQVFEERGSIKIFPWENFSILSFFKILFLRKIYRLFLRPVTAAFADDIKQRFLMDFQVLKIFHKAYFFFDQWSLKFAILCWILESIEPNCSPIVIFPNWSSGWPSSIRLRLLLTSSQVLLFILYFKILLPAEILWLRLIVSFLAFIIISFPIWN